MAEKSQQQSARQSRPSSEAQESQTIAATDQKVELKPREQSVDKLPTDSATKTPSPIPNGGLTAWLQVVGGFMLFFNTWGLLNTFASFQTYYESGVLFKESSSNISWVGSFSLVFGLMMLSICKTYWQVLLAQGFCIGIGAGCLWVPCVAILPTYFNTKLGLVVGLAFSGSSVGGVVYPIVFYQLINRIGFGWSVRVLGFIALGTLLFPLAVMKMRVKPPKPRSLIDWTAFLDFPYMMFTIAGLIGYIGLFSLFFYISFYPYARHITDRKLAFYIVPIFNAASVLGRIVPNAISDKTGPFNLIAPGVLIFGVLNFCMMAVTTVAADVVMAILTGFFSGLFICLPPVCFVALTNDKSKIGTRMGMGYSIIALGVLAGGPGGGNILGTVDPLNWNGLWAYSGATTCAAGLLFAAVRVVRSGWKLNIKA